MYPRSPRNSSPMNNSPRGGFTSEQYSNRQVVSVQIPPSSYHKSQLECLEQLQKYRNSLMQEEHNITLSMETYYKDLQESARAEHQRVRSEVLRMLDESFQRNWNYLNQAIIFQGEPGNFSQARKRIQTVNNRLAQLEMGLKTENYRVCIAEVVTSNFDLVIEEINSAILNTKQSLNNNVLAIVVDHQKLRILTEAVSSILTFNATPTMPTGIIQTSIVNSIMSGNSRPKSPTMYTTHTKKIETEAVKFI